MAFFAELKRRNVIRVGIAYIVVAWLVLQFSDVVLNNVEAPDWVFQVIMLLLAIGFPLVLLFAWAFELTPEGIKKEKDIDRSQSITTQTGKKLSSTIFVLMALGIAYLLFDKFSSQSDVEHTAQQIPDPQALAVKVEKTLTPVQVSINPQSIAVLPFTNRSRQEEDEFFVAGMHDDLLTNLARIGSLKVISRTSVTQYKDTEKTIPDIARELGVATIMEGAVQRSGNTVRINVQLIDAESDKHLWAEIYDRELTTENLFAIQSEISQAIADALKTTLSPEEKQQINTRPTENLAAYNAYLRGRQLLAHRRSNELEQALQQFSKAVELDPQFALAWVGLAESTNLLSFYGTLAEEIGFPVIEDAVNKALAIDANNGEAYTSLASLYDSRGRYKEAETAYKKAIALTPNYATTYHWYGMLLLEFSSRSDESIDLFLKAQALDPYSAIINTALAGGYESGGLFSLAEQQYLKIIDFDNDFAEAYVSLAAMYILELGRFDKGVEYARKAAELDPGNFRPLSNLVMAYLNLGDARAVESTIQRMQELDASHYLTAFTSVPASLLTAKPAGTQELINWAMPKLQALPGSAQFIAQIQLQIGAVAKARELYLTTTPAWLQADQWSQLIEKYPDQACIVAWVFMQTGNEELGISLQQQTLSFHEQILSATHEHVDMFLTDVCYLAAGDTEKAITSITTQVEHGHLFLLDQAHAMPMYDPIREDPRYLAAMAEREQIILEQRSALQGQADL